MASSRASARRSGKAPCTTTTVSSLTGSLLDYAIPRADVLPDIDVLSTVTPSPHHPLGVKGIGEAGTIASTATVYNAVIDALRAVRRRQPQMPLTPERVWRAMQR